MVFIRFQYHLQRHFVVLVVARLVVDITIMQVPIATRRFVFIPMDLQDLSVGLLQVPNKQWGTNTIGSRTTRTEAYPLPYSEFCLPIVSGKGYVGGLNYGFGVGVTNFGLTSVTIANNSEDSSYRWTGYTYIVVGAQPQWGIISNNKAIFPLVFNVFVSSALLLSRGSGTGTWYGDSSNITLTGISCVTPDYVLSGTYIAIGA